MAWVPLVVAGAISVAYTFVFGIDWGFTFRSGTVSSAIVTGLFLSVWAYVPYLVLVPIGRQGGQLLFTTLAALVILAFGMLAMDRGRHTPGDEGGSYIIVPIQQMGIAAAIRFCWWAIRGIAHWAHTGNSVHDDPRPRHATRYSAPRDFD
jgi:hypothetical protein